MKIDKVYILLITSIVVICCAALMTYINSQKYQALNTETNRLQQLLLATSDLMCSVNEAESGQMGYFLTGNKAYLASYDSFVSRSAPERKNMLALAASDTCFEKDITRIFKNIDRKGVELSRSIEAYSNNKESAIKMLEANEGLHLMDSIRLMIEQLKSKEMARIRQVENDYLSYTSEINLLRYFIQCIVVLISIAAIFAIRRKNKRNVKLVLELKHTKSQLEEMVVERTRDLYKLSMELQSQNEEIQSQTEQISNQNDKLIDLNEEKNKYIGIATHDMKSPLNRIKGLVNIIKMNPEASVESQKEYFGIMLRTIDHMHELLGNMLDLNKIEQRALQFHFETFQLDLFLKDLIKMFEEEALVKEISLRLIIKHPGIMLHSDKSSVLQILENLVSNAIKFSEKHKEVIVFAERENDVISVGVQDQGPGIAPEEMPLLFKRFQKLSARPTAGENSTGLGLSIVKELVNELGGEIRCESEMGRGTTFYVEFKAST